MSGCHSSTPSPAPSTATATAPATAAGSLPAATRSGRAGRSLVAERLAARRVLGRRVAGSFAAMAVVGATLSLAAAPGEAIGVPARAKAPTPAFAGYSSSSTASPMQFEIYEPTIPIPAEPQAEFSFGYSAAEADSSSSRSRASFLWPGDPIGEGFKTIIEQLGLPAELAAPLGKNGYPVQVNAEYPSGPDKAVDEPLPGLIQRAEAADDTARADNGASTDGQPRDVDDDGKGGGESPVPGLPGLPGVPGLPGIGSLSDLTDALTGQRASTPQSKRGTGSAAAAAPGLPAPLATLINLGSFTSISLTENDKDAFAQSRSIASDISILGGVVTIEGVKTVANASSDGKKGKGAGVAEYGDLVIAGQRFTFGPDGYVAAGTRLPIPGFPADGGKLLERLGITISVPKPVYTVKGDAASTSMPGLTIDFDLKVLRKQVGPLTNALDGIVTQLPEDLGPLKSGVQAAANLAPRIVVTLGTSFAGVDTSQAITPPPTPVEEPAEENTGTSGGGGGGAPASSGGGGTPSAPTDSSPVAPAPTTDAPAGDEAVAPVAAAAAVPGLPPLLSFPGLLLYGGLLGAALAGALTRRLGLLALGSAGSCPHGLTSGLPDLRKVT